MTESSKNISKKTGLPPGALVHIGSRKTDKVKISIIDYNANNYSESIVEKTEDCYSFKDSDSVSWINIDGLHDIDSIDSLGQHFNLHRLLLEDVLNTNHRPKLEEFDNCLFVSLKMLGISKDGKSVVYEQISLVLGKNWLITFQEIEGDIFESLRQRLREKKGNIREKGADYLFYRIIDTIVDNYFIVTEHISEVIEGLEEKAINNPDDKLMQDIQQLKKQLINLRKAVNPLREIVASLEKDSSSLIHKGTVRYLRDVYEHIIHVNESIETERDMLGSIMDLYQTGVSNRMNKVMQVLTIIATIFIPMTFIAGVYGMNFDFMPELHWKYGYLGAWGIMLAVLAAMLAFFKRKRWL
ncbi:MAG: magnesium/cobalt transporter CorA [Saprospiraceae bacterium]|nr:magnesium/cobalt transporter CorA [Saprospiraceae bacterium]